MDRIHIKFKIIGIYEVRLKKDSSRKSKIHIKGYTFEHAPTE